MSVSYIELATLRILAQCLHQLHHQDASLITYQNAIFMSPSLYRKIHLASCVSSGRCNYLHLSCHCKSMTRRSLTSSRQHASRMCPSHFAYRSPHALRQTTNILRQSGYLHNVPSVETDVFKIQDCSVTRLVFVLPQYSSRRTIIMSFSVTRDRHQLR